MTKKKGILIGGVIVLCLLVCLCVAMCAPGGQKPAEESTVTQPSATIGTGTRNYTIEIENQGGQPLEEIGVYIYTDSTMQELVWFAKTDAEGALSFEDAASDSYVAVLSGVPAGYLVEEYYPLTGETTKIVLEAGLMEGDLSNLNYKLGDLMLDFTVTGPDGKEYVFSELLEQKKAIVLNFWYLQCDPCKSEFPYLQEAYEKYDEDVIVLAMNPVNTEDAEIAQFQKDNGYTFPMVKCDPAWEKAMNITAYPTTVVIDRFGNICMIHKGSITEAETFETIFDFFSAEDYEQTFVEDIEDLEEAAGVEQTVGTKDNPVEMGMTPSFQVTVEPGQQMYYNIYRITGTVYLSMNATDISLTYKGGTYKNNAYFGITAESTSTAVQLIFENTGDETKTFTVYLGRAKGSYDNPYSLELGEFTAKVGAGNESGVYYTYTAEASGLFKVSVLDVTDGVNYNIVAYNLTTYAQRNSQDDGTNESGYKSVGVNVSKGDKIQVIVGTLPDSSNTYPAGTFELKAEIREGESEGSQQTKMVVYSVNVTNEKREPVPNVMMTLKTATGSVTLKTNEKGYATSRQTAGTYSVVLTVPSGFSAKTTEFILSEEYPSVSVKLDTLEQETYTIRVVNAQGEPIVGAYVSVEGAYAVTDANGVALLTAAKAELTVTIAADGYQYGEVKVSPESTDVSITLEPGDNADKVEYTVTAQDYYGAPVSGLRLTLRRGSAVVAAATTNASGNAVFSVVPGTYDVGGSEDVYIQEMNAGLTEENHSITILAIVGPTEEDQIYGNPVDVLPLGATYVGGLQDNGKNLFVFAPYDASGEIIQGMYRVTAKYSDARVSYWGNSTSYVENDLTSTGTLEYNSAANSYILNIKPAHTGSSFVIGLTGDTEAVVVIERIGDAKLDITDIKATAYEAKCTIEYGFTLELDPGETLNYVDFTDSSVTIHRDSEGYYHLNSVNGPQLYVNLGETAPYFRLCDAMGVTDEHGVYNLIDDFYKADGTPDYRIEYNTCLKKYVEACYEYTDVHPLNDDLVYILQRASQLKGWGDPNSPDFILKDNISGEAIEGVEEDLAWMYACCYVG